MPDTAVRALVVEDDPSWQQILTEMLTDMHLSVEIASSYPEAVEKLRSAPHRLAILDLSLGGTDHHNQDGLRVAESVRRIDPSCTILFLTGFATVELAVQVMKDLNAFTCLRKETFRRSEFRKVINDALARAVQPAAQTEEPLLENAALAAPSAEARSPGGEGTVLVIEDDAGWRELLTELLTDAGFLARTTSSYVESLGLLKREHIDLAVVDLSLASSVAQENQDGFRLLSAMQKANIPVLVVSGYIDPQRIEQAYKDGLVFTCLEKQSFDRRAFVDHARAARGQSGRDPVLESLTDREREVLALLARGLTNKEIARELTITPNTVKRHLKSLFAKLDVSTRSAASARAISMGIAQGE